MLPGSADSIQARVSGEKISMRTNVNTSDIKGLGALGAMLSDRERARTMGMAAGNRVQQQFLGPHHLGRYFEVIQRVVSQREHAARVV